MKPMWIMYDYVFYSNHTRAERKQAIKDMISAGWSAYNAITTMRDYEHGAEHGP